MAATDSLFSGSVPEFYDRYLVPLIFDEFAADMARRVAGVSPRAVLETAAGTGAVTRALAPLLGAEASYMVTDLNQPMLDYARGRQGEDDRIAWQKADALSLPFADASFDAVCCQFGAMFFPDRVLGYSQARRVLRPGGCFVFNVWDRIASNEFADMVTKSAAALFPDDPPMFLARTPHGYHDTDMIRRDVEKAGFSRVELHTLKKTSSAPSPQHVAIAYCQGTPLRDEIEARDPSRLVEVTDHAAADIAARYGKGPVSAKIQGHVVVATA